MRRRQAAFARGWPNPPKLLWDNGSAPSNTCTSYIWIFSADFCGYTGRSDRFRAEALNGTMTITLVKTETGARIALECVVRSYMRMIGEELAPMVDGIFGKQMASLAATLNAATADWL